MARDKISEYDATAGNNTVVGDINISEGMPPSLVNNALREILSHLKEMDVGTFPLTSPQITSINLGHASDTTIARSGAGAITIEGVAATTATNTQTLTNKTLTSPVIGTAITHADNVKAKYGTGNDLEIYHDASHSYISDTGTGSLVVKATDLYLQDASGNRFLYGAAGGTVELYHNASAKLTTTSGGITVTGAITGTLATAAQTNITSLGTLTALTVDNISINGTTIGHTSDTDAISISSGGVVTMNQIPVFSAGINVSGGTIAGTLATAAQGNVTSLGTLSALTVSGGQVHIQDATRELKIGTSGYILDHESGGHLAFRSHSDAERVRFLDNGNVAIGATSAATKLHLTGSDGVSTALRITGTNRSYDFKIASGGSNLIIEDASGGQDAWVWSAGGSQSNNYAEVHVWNDKTDGSDGEYMRITSAGRLGIGIAAPSYPLDVYGVAAIKDAESLTWKGNAQLSAAIVGSGSSAYLGFWTSVNERMRLTDTGLGIGVSAPEHPLDVQNSSNVCSIMMGKSGVSDGILATKESMHFVIDFDNSQTDRFYAWDTNGYGSTELMRLTEGGRLGVGNGSPNSAKLHVNNSPSNEQVAYLTAEHASYANINLILQVARAANSAYSFLRGQSDNGSDHEFNLRGDGAGYADAGWHTGADYAEFWEWADGNPNNEDRRGYSVILEDDKIRTAVSDDDPTKIIGVISGNPCVVGDTAWNRWKQKYLRDEFGAYDLDKNGDRQPNPEYDPDQDYIPREERQEWSAVGLVGKLRVRKGQPVGDRWIKMKEINPAIEEWLIR